MKLQATKWWTNKQCSCKLLVEKKSAIGELRSPGVRDRDSKPKKILQKTPKIKEHRSGKRREKKGPWAFEAMLSARILCCNCLLGFHCQGLVLKTPWLPSCITKLLVNYWRWWWCSSKRFLTLSQSWICPILIFSNNGTKERSIGQSFMNSNLVYKILVGSFFLLAWYKTVLRQKKTEWSLTFCSCLGMAIYFVLV